MNKKCISILSFVFIAICVAAALLVHFLSPGITSEISADGMLGYIASGISAVSTLILAVVAVMQTKKANQMSEHLMELEDNRYKLEVRPFVMISNWKAYTMKALDIYTKPQALSIQIGEVDESDEVVCMELFFQNTTDSFEQLSYWGCKATDDSFEWKYSASNQNNMKLQIQPNDSKSIVFYAREDWLRSQIGKWMKMELIFENRFADKYKETIDILITSLNLNNPGTEYEKWDFMLFAQNYRIGKFVGEKGEKIRWE